METDVRPADTPIGGRLLVRVLQSGDTAREVAEMMIFRTATGREIVYVETRWSKVNVYPHLERALAKGLIERVG